MSETKVRLAELLKSLREELVEARDAAAKEDVQFSLQDIEVEVQFAVSSEVVAGGKLNFWVFTLESSGKLGSQTTHKLTFKLIPKDRDGRDLKISDRERRAPS